MQVRTTAVLLCTLILLTPSRPASAEKEKNRWLHSQTQLPVDFPVDATVLPGKRVKSDKHPFRVAPFSVDQLRWGSMSSEPVRVLVVGRERVQVLPAEGADEVGEGFSFVLVEPERPSWEVSCRSAGFRWLSIAEGSADAVGDEAASGMVCRLRAEGDPVPWRLALRSSAPELVRTSVPKVSDAADGVLTGGETSLRIHTCWKVGGFSIGSGFPTGFLFSQGDRWVAGVDAHGAGGLVLAAPLGERERSAVAAASAALTVYQSRLVLRAMGVG